MARVNPPQQKVPESIRALSPELFDYLIDARFFDYQLWRRTGGGDDAIENVDTDTSARSGISVAKLFQLEARIEQIEQSSNEGILHSKIASLNKRIDELIAELIAEIRLLRPDTDLEEKKASLLQAAIKQLELLNDRTEEAYETTIEEEEI